MKRNIYNLIILDRSGSMGSIALSAIDGVNRTVASIVESITSEDSCKQTISLMPFCGCNSDYIYKDANPSQVKALTSRDYQPCCTTPLYDAIGRGINDLLEKVKADKNAVGSVTIITDGYENSSTKFSREDVKKLIDQVKEMGWMVAYIGADHDVERVAFELSIQNTMSFDKNPEGVQRMFAVESRSRRAWSEKVKDCLGVSELKSASDNYFD